jgi:hypothetical protein
MRFVRVLVLAGVALVSASACANATAMASNKAGVWVTVSPGTVNAGSQLQVKASCDGGSTSATVTSSAFGSLTLQSSTTGNATAASLTGTTTVPANTAKGTYDVRMTCSSGSKATTTVIVSNGTSGGAGNVPGPNTGGGYLANNDQPTSGLTALAHDPAARGPVLWLGLAVLCLVAATLLGLRHRASRFPPSPSGRATRRSPSGRAASRAARSGAAADRAAALDPDKVPLEPPADPWARVATPSTGRAGAAGAGRPAAQRRC